jgi:acyl CoA:acetate/3-ketoacid CoA transferase
MLITQRAVFELTSTGRVIIEIAAGVRLKGKVIHRTGFKPIEDGAQTMDPAPFTP